MDNFKGGITLMVIGLLLAFLTYKKYDIFWGSHNTKILRKYFGDKVTSVIFYLLSILFIIFGYLVAKGIVL